MAGPALCLIKLIPFVINYVFEGIGLLIPERNLKQEWVCPCYGEKHFPPTLEVSGPQASSELAILPPGAGSSVQVGPADGRAWCSPPAWGPRHCLLQLSAGCFSQRSGERWVAVRGWKDHFRSWVEKSWGPGRRGSGEARAETGSLSLEKHPSPAYCCTRECVHMSLLREGEVVAAWTGWIR